ncbi:MAG: FHA domain-containing protein [Anaerolineae bacterium]|nr:FHA domain-containing protein [Anaerolineae bacterium]
MSFGRVDVYWPDGPIESYGLEKPIIAIGRSIGNDIVLDTTAVSRYHVTIGFDNRQAVLTDLESVNGTYVDGSRLAPNEPYSLNGGEEIQIGDVRLIFHPSVDVTGVGAETTQLVSVAQPTYCIEFEGPSINVAPGSHVQATLKIENVSQETDSFFIEVDGLPDGWGRLDRAEVEIDPGEQSQVVLSFKPLRRSDSQPGDYPVVVRVRSRSNPAQTIEIPSTFRVLPFSGFGIALGSERIQGSNGVKLYVHNQGSAPLSLDIQGVDQKHHLGFQLSQAMLTLEPGERRTLTGAIKPRRRRLFGHEYEHEFLFIARAHDASGFLAAVPGTYVDTGMFPAWVPVLVVPVLAVLVLLVVGTILLALGGESADESSPPQPVITTFTVSNQAIKLGEAVQLTWEVADAESLELAINSSTSQQSVAVGADDLPYTLAFDQTGLYTLTLIALNGQAKTTAMATVEVRPAIVKLELDVLDALELVRYVEHDVRISWEVEGASPQDDGYSVWVESSDRADALIPPPLALSDSQTVQVVPGAEEAEWLVTLYTEGRDGVVASMTQKLSIVYPSCELRASRTFVRSGPGESYPALAPLESSDEGNPSLSPTARDLEGEWLQVSIGVGDNARIGWVWREDFACTNFEPDRLAATGDYPPPPPADDDQANDDEALDADATPATGTPSPRPTH